MLSRVRGFRQAELARRAGVSRQVVSYWFKLAEKGIRDVNVYSKNQEALAAALSVSGHTLSEALPLVEYVEQRKLTETELIWDRLYPDLESFVSALIYGEMSALARLVQVYGLFRSEKIIGKKVWSKFPAYRKLMHPTAQRKCEIIWKRLHSPVQK